MKVLQIYKSNQAYLLEDLGCFLRIGDYQLVHQSVAMTFP
jgi:hypothetical protein